jgi:hypothetical protein
MFKARFRRFSGLAATIALGLGVVVACGDAGPADFDLYSAPPRSTNVDAGSPGPGNGDFTTFSAEVSNVNGETVLPDDRAMFINSLVFTFDDGSTISVLGSQSATLGSTGYNGSADPGDRAIVGGTGTYAGVTGTLTTSLGPNDSRLQEFRFSS